jgi:ferredoxin like protein
MKPMSVTERLGHNKYDLDESHPHIEIDHDVCQVKCKVKPCLYVCPANVYSEQDGLVVPDWAGCLECGTCVVACPDEALHWVYPRGGFGVIYREG